MESPSSVNPYQKDENFEQLSQKIASNTKKISQNGLSMSKLVNQLLTPQDSPELRNQLRHIQKYTQRLAKDTSSMLIELMKLHLEDPLQKEDRDSLSDEYIKTLNSFQATQRAAVEKTKHDVRKVKAQTMNVGALGPMNSNTDNWVELAEVNLQTQQQIVQSEQELQELEARERDIQQLESDITDVNHIYKQLGTMIHDQGGLVDSIESNIDNVVHNVDSGVQELRQAATYKNKLRKKKVIIGCVLLLIICILLIVFLHR